MWQLILLQGVGVGVGGGILYMPVIKLLPEWFSERRGLAGGIIFSGTGVGGFAFPFLLNTLLDKVGLRWTLRIWAIGTSLCSAIALLGMRSRFPVPRYGSTQRRPKFIPPQLTFLKNALFWSFVSAICPPFHNPRLMVFPQAFTNLLQGLSYFPVSLYIVTFTRTISDQITATVILALFNSSAVLGQVLLGHLTDRFPYPSIMVVSSVGSALGAFLLWGFANAAIYLYFFAVIFGCLVRCLYHTRHSFMLMTSVVEWRILLDMDKRRGRVRREQSRVCWDGFLRARVLERRLGSRRAYHFWSAPGGREGRIDESRIWPLWIWSGRDLRRILRTGNWRGEYGSRISETKGTLMS